MIVVDTSVWIGLLRGSNNLSVDSPRRMQAVEDILIGDLVLLELLQGSRGITIRKTADLIIGTFCIERGHELLHADQDFAPMVEHLGLRLASV